MLLEVPKNTGYVKRIREIIYPALKCLIRDVRDALPAMEMTNSIAPFEIGGHPPYSGERRCLLLLTGVRIGNRVICIRFRPKCPRAVPATTRLGPCRCKVGHITASSTIEEGVV